MVADGLFKFRYRPTTGDDWAEKIAAELATLIGIPHAIVELAECRGEPGVISLDFTEKLARGELVLGNELLLEVDPDYPSTERYKVVRHTVEKVMGVLSQTFVALPADFTPVPEVRSAAELFLGYLALDTVISNTDRHHENWGLLVRGAAEGAREASLAPSFDHATSLGQILTDDERQDRRETRDEGYTVALQR